jgi:hypothetical protein
VAGSTCDYRVCAETLEGCEKCIAGSGTCRRLVKVAAQGGIRIVLGDAESLQVYQERVPLSRSSGSEEEIRFRLRPVEGKTVAIEDDDELDGGLCQTTLIFGGPGSGKTYLFLRLLRQYFAIQPASLPTGGLILDPKGVLLDEMDEVLAGRGKPVVIGPAKTAADRPAADGPAENQQDPDEHRPTNINLLNVGDAMDDRQFGHLLADIVISAFSGIGEGWDSFVYVMLETAVPLLRAMDGDVTLRSLVRGIVANPTPIETMGHKLTLKPQFVVQAEQYKAQLEAAQAKVDAEFLEAFQRASLLIQTSESPQIRYVMQLVETALGASVGANWQSLSCMHEDGPFERIIRDGAVVIVSIGEGDPVVRRCVSTISKALFQIVVSNRLNDADASAKKRAVVLACDEYAQVITERDADGLSDSSFFSRSRQYRCLNLLALQSVHMGLSRVKNEHLWNAIVANANVRIFMSVNDAETASLGSSSAGKSTILSPVSSWTDSESGRNYSQGSSLIERSAIPEIVLLSGLERGHGVAVGRLNGRKPDVAYFKVPNKGADATEEGGAK